MFFSFMDEINNVVSPNVKQVMLHFKPQYCYISCYIECNRPILGQISVYSAGNLAYNDGGSCLVYLVVGKFRYTLLAISIYKFYIWTKKLSEIYSG